MYTSVNPRVVFGAIAHVEPAQPRHHHVEKYQVRLGGFDHRQRLLAIRRVHELDSFVLELL